MISIYTVSEFTVVSYRALNTIQTENTLNNTDNCMCNKKLKKFLLNNIILDNIPFNKSFYIKNN